jgi:predicted N-formylglutamate amidohydrolase
MPGHSRKSDAPMRSRPPTREKEVVSGSGAFHLPPPAARLPALWLIVTCEHGGNRIPPAYWPLFRAHRAKLRSHLGYDPGALTLARDLATGLGAELVYSTTSRLLVELNRSLHHPRLFSEVIRKLAPAERRLLLEHYYYPYRAWVEGQIAEVIENGARALHISSHSFTPLLGQHARQADVGLLYDPRRAPEARFSRAWQRALQAADPQLVVRRNYPYRGSADGLTTALRERFAEDSYCGIELEVNQKYPLGERGAWTALRKLLVSTLQHVVAENS